MLVLCVGVKKRSGRNTTNIPGKGRGGHLLWQLRKGDGRAPGGEELSIAPCCRQTNRWMGKKPGKVKELILDVRVEVKESSVCLEATKCSGNQQILTSYIIKIDKGTLAETERKCFAVCTGWMNWSVLKWCLTTAATIHSGLLQLSNKWHTGSAKAQPIKTKSSITSKAADPLESEGNIFLRV